MIHDPILRLVNGAMRHWSVSLDPNWIGYGDMVALFVATQFLAATLVSTLYFPRKPACDDCLGAGQPRW